MSWALASIALAVLAVLAISRRLEGTPVTPPMVFLIIGLFLGPQLVDAVDISLATAVRTLANATLALVLFTDASRIDLRALRRAFTLPARLLGIGLPLTIVMGALIAAALFGELTGAEAVVLGIVLTPTDAALGQAVVADERLPLQVRQGLNVESGLNDGICVPLLLVAIAAADIESSVFSTGHAVSVAVEEIGYGLLGGVLAGLVTAAVTRLASKHHLIAPGWRQLAPAAGAALAFGLADGFGGSGLIAAFVAGVCFGWFLRGETATVERFNEELADLLGGVTFVVFGAVLLGPALSHISWQMVLYALLSLTIARLVPVALALLGTHARPQTIAFLGWFGPRGLASIVFALTVVQTARLPHDLTIVRAAYLTVGLSVLAHGLTASPLAARYGRWLARQPPGQLSNIEVGDAPALRLRGARHVHGLTRESVEVNGR